MNNKWLMRGGIVLLILIILGTILLLLKPNLSFFNTPNSALKPTSNVALTGITCPVAFICKQGANVTYDGHPALGYTLLPKTSFFSMGKIIDAATEEKVILETPIKSVRTTFMHKGSCYQTTYITPRTTVTDNFKKQVLRGAPIGVSSTDTLTVNGKTFNLIVMLQEKKLDSSSKSEKQKCTVDVASSGDYIELDVDKLD